MITISAGVRVLLATHPVDFRKGAHGLAALAAGVLAEDPFSGVVVQAPAPARLIEGGLPPLAFHLLRRRNLGQFRPPRRWSPLCW